MSIKHVFRVEAMVFGTWDAHIDEILSCEREVGNIHDTFAVTIKKDGE